MKTIRGHSWSPPYPFPCRTRPQARRGCHCHLQLPARGQRGWRVGRAQVRRDAPGRAEPPLPTATLRSPRRGRPAAMGNRETLPARPACRTGQCLRGEGAGRLRGCAEGGATPRAVHSRRAALGRGARWGRGATRKVRGGCAVQATRRRA